MAIHLRTTSSSGAAHDAAPSTPANRPAGGAPTRAKPGNGVLQSLKRLVGASKSSTAPRTPLARSALLAPRISPAPAMTPIREAHDDDTPLASLGQHYREARQALGKTHAQAEAALTPPKLSLFAGSKERHAAFAAKRGQLEAHAAALQSLLDDTDSAALDRQTVTQLAAHPEVPRHAAAQVRGDIDQTLQLRRRAQQTLNTVQRWIADIDKKLGARPVPNASLAGLMREVKPRETTRKQVTRRSVGFEENTGVMSANGTSERRRLSTKPGGGNEESVPKVALDLGSAKLKHEIGINKAAEAMLKHLEPFPPEMRDVMLASGKIPDKALEKGAPYGATQADAHAILAKYREFVALDEDD